MKARPVFYSLSIGLLAIELQAREFSPGELDRRALERRAVEAVIWGMPAVNFDLMYILDRTWKFPEAQPQ